MNPDSHDPTLSERAHSHDMGELLTVASNPALTEEIALAMLTRRDLAGNVIEAIAKNPAVLKHRKITLAIASHPRAPRHVSLPMVRHLYTFELAKIALIPAVPADVKIGVDETIIARLEQVSEGERLTLARQASGRVAGALLLDKQERVSSAALTNPKMTEAVLIKALNDSDATPHLVHAVCTHAQWSLRRDIRLALLRNKHTDLAHAILFAKSFPDKLLREILSKSAMRDEIKHYLLAALPELKA